MTDPVIHEPSVTSLTESQLAAKKVVLASDALREDLAPIEPWLTASRWWAVVLGALLASTAAIPPLLLHQTGWRHWVPHLVLGGIALLAGLTPVPYTLRAAALTFTAAATAIAGVAGYGPAGGLSMSVGEYGLLHLLAAAGLPAALLFRARYRAYKGARSILAVALTLALPFVAFCVLEIMHSSLGAQITSAVALVSVLATLIGFMGSETTVAGQWVGAFVISAVTAQLASSTVTQDWIPSLDAGLLWVAGSIAAFAACSILGAIGMFQLLARRHWDDARSVDLRRAKTERPPMPSIGDTWSTRQ